jgi:hypothetical protein
MVVFAGIKYLEKHLKALKIAKFRRIALGLAIFSAFLGSIITLKFQKY